MHLRVEDRPSVSVRIARNQELIRAASIAESKGIYMPKTAEFIRARAIDAIDWLQSQPDATFNQRRYATFLANGDQLRYDQRTGARR